MKFFSLIVGVLCYSTSVFSQPNPTVLDLSPMDMSYWPANYPLLKMDGKVKDAPVARIIYSRPQKRGRAIFDSLIKYNQLWRLGANEATEIEFFKNVNINGKPITKGRYTIYCIPDSSKWTLIINKDNFTWGNFTYDQKKDVLRKELPLQKSNQMVEVFSMYFEDKKSFANLIILWDNAKVVLPISL